MLASMIEFVHALMLVIWVSSMPLLFWHRWPALSTAIACYSLFFIVVNRLGHWLLGECVLTRLARMCGDSQDPEWFIVKFSRAVFGFIPSNKQVIYVEQFLVVCVAIGVAYTLLKRRQRT